MIGRNLRALAALLAAAVVALAMSLWPRTSHAQCLATDTSYVVYYGSCGNTEYQLQVGVDGGVVEDYEQAYAFGTCYPPYYDCRNVYIPPGDHQGAEFMYQDYAGEEYDSVYWEMDDLIYQGTDSCDDGYPDDVSLIIRDYPDPTPDFEAQCY
jgi:hypothetical protein